MSEVEESRRNLMILCLSCKRCNSRNLHSGQDRHKSRAMRKKGRSKEVEHILLEPFPSSVIFVFPSSVFLYFRNLHFLYFPHRYFAWQKRGEKGGWAQLGGTLFPHLYFGWVFLVARGWHRGSILYISYIYIL